MKKACMMFADGLEEAEALVPLDILRRGGIDVTMVSITGKKEVTGSHGITVLTEELIEDVDFRQMDMLILPGGMPGTVHLTECQLLKDKILEFDEQGKRIAAICAAPRILGALKLLEGKKAICYPGNEELLLGAEISSESVITDGNITTAKGMGVATGFGLELLKLLAGEEVMMEIRKAIMYPF